VLMSDFGRRAAVVLEAAGAVVAAALITLVL
jgi:hypothetical protein